MYERVKNLLSYDEDTGCLTWIERPNSPAWNAKHAGKRAGCLDVSEGYVRVAIDRRLYLAHRLAWLIFTGEEPDKIDHINGDRSDNRIVNLRNVSTADNNRNVKMRKDNTSGVTGVSPCRQSGQWRASIKIDGRNKCLGRYDDLAAAVAARRQAEILCGFHPNHGRT